MLRRWVLDLSMSLGLGLGLVGLVLDMVGLVLVMVLVVLVLEVIITKDRGRWIRMTMIRRMGLGRRRIISLWLSGPLAEG